MAKPIDVNIDTPKLFMRCLRIWNAMREQAHPYADPESFGDNEKRLIYVGHISTLADQVGEARNYIGQLTRRLRNMGCIAQLRRGGGKGIGQWVILEEPTIALFTASHEMVVPDRSRWQQRMEQRIKDLATEVESLKAQAHGH